MSALLHFWGLICVTGDEKDNDDDGDNERMTTSGVFQQFGYFTSWWSTVIILLVVIAGILILLKTCLDCTGLAHSFFCCGDNSDVQSPIYKLDIHYKAREEEEEDVEENSEDVESQSEEDQDQYSST